MAEKRSNTMSSAATDHSPPLKVFRRDPKAVLPRRATEGSAGYDICALEAGTIPSGHRMLVQTGLSFSVPKGHYGRVAPRSGLSIKNGIDVAAGVIDPDYTGPVGIALVNNGVSEFSYAAGERIAQLLLVKISTLDVEEVSALEETDRGSGGWGSTGKAAFSQDAP